jgi:hypothetical protein
MITKYSELPSFIGNISKDDCLFWGGTQNSSTDFIHQRVVFTDYTRLIDSGRALYEFSFDSGGIDAYKDFVYLTIEFRAPNSQSLGSFRFRKYTR